MKERGGTGSKERSWQDKGREEKLKGPDWGGGERKREELERLVLN